MQFVDLTVQPIFEPVALHMVWDAGFADVARPQKQQYPVQLSGSKKGERGRAGTVAH